MKRFLLSAALLTMAFGVNAQIGVKSVTSTTGTQFRLWLRQGTGVLCTT